MATVQHITNESSAVSLADLLNGDSRSRPVAVVTTPHGLAEPRIDVEAVAREAGDLAEVYLLPTGPLTWEFSQRMPEGTQVYGGAGRVYPVGHQWATDLAKSPLRFAFSDRSGEVATQHVISDMLRMAASAGLLEVAPTRGRRRVGGEVKMIVAGRALVDIGNAMPASIAEELTVEDIPIDRLVVSHQRVEGWYDIETNRVDVTEGLRPSMEALKPYSSGDVVLAKVMEVHDVGAELLLYPKTSTPAVSVAVDRDDVTGNPLDDLRTLMTVGEVVPARVVATKPQWALVLNDIDDDEPIVDAPSLLVDGPPWLVEEPDESEAAQPQLLEALAPPAPPVATAAVDGEPPSVGTAAAAPPRPSPVLLDKNREDAGSSRGGAVATPPAKSTKELLLKIDGLAATVTGLEREQDHLRTQLAADADERNQLRYLLDQAERRANRAEHELKAARARLRKAGATKPAPAPGEGPQFADAEQGFRYLVLTRWATRTQPGEQADRPLPDYVVDPRFLDSLHQLEGIKDEKVADVVFEIVTGLAPRIPGREVHHLRTGPGGGDPNRVRADGAIAWRASLQVRTPAARRIHYWVLPDGRIELARVATHDDFDA